MTPVGGAGGPDGQAVDLSSHKRIHVVGIGGAGMSAIAEVLVAMGHAVSGSDQQDSRGLDRLRDAGIAVRVGHDAANVAGPTWAGSAPIDLVAASTAVPADNPEVLAARGLGILVLRRADVLACIADLRRTVAVSGTHGKTTTAAMLAMVLAGAGLQPSFIVGGDLHEVGSGARWDEGEWLVVEADESDGTFVELRAEMAVVTNIESDHLDYYGDLATIEATFDRFLGDAPGPNLVCADDPGAARSGGRHGSLSYGTAQGSDFRIVEPTTGRLTSAFGLVQRRQDGSVEELGEVAVPAPGLHNVRNAAAAIAAGIVIGVSFAAAREAIAHFGGVGRRFQSKGSKRGITVVDDYAHNPGKVAAVLTAAHAGGWRRVVAVFQPHRYSRTSDLAAEFANSFHGADVLVVTDVYPAGEPARPGVSGKLIVDAVLDAHPRSRVVWLPERADLIPFLRSELRDGDLCLTLGAGDVTTLGDELLDQL